ncbi:hypothetical protein 8UZL_00003 [Mycobacteroides phage 8UZL]|nr:hypothetical protein 8UZL_00003 [Mycobacteroides phage 8UZL]
MVEKGQVYRFYHKDLHDESSGFFPTGMYVSQTKVIRPTPITCGRHSKEHIDRGGYQKINLTLHLSPGPPSITFD